MGKKTMRYTRDVDLELSKNGNSKYLYDPDMSTVKPNYDKCKSKAACDEEWEKRFKRLMFNPRKMLRLAFHDCVGYKDDPKGTGCDGCLNFDESKIENQGLQHTVAVMEQLYTNVDFPKMRRRDPNLDASPYDLGMSRADLWAFAGLVALDFFQAQTEDICKKKPNIMCDNSTSTSCFTQFPRKSKNMFKTGRIGKYHQIKVFNFHG